MTQEQLDLIEKVDTLIRVSSNQLLLDLAPTSTLQCFDAKSKITNALYVFVTSYNKLIKFPGRSPRARKDPNAQRS